MFVQEKIFLFKRNNILRHLIGDLSEVKSQILNAKNMAREKEMESGNNVTVRLSCSCQIKKKLNKMCDHIYINYLTLSSHICIIYNIFL